MYFDLTCNGLVNMDASKKGGEMKDDLALEACRAMVNWFDGEMLSGDERMDWRDLYDLCKYAEWCARKALGQDVGEFEGCPRLVISLRKGAK